MLLTNKGNGFFQGRTKGFKFTISIDQNKKDWYVTAVHQKKDIRLNTLWINEMFSTKELAKIFCEKFNYKQYNCIGDDV